jgi:membrane protein implicated in regulation of membrane protease activity
MLVSGVYGGILLAMDETFTPGFILVLIGSAIVFVGLIVDLAS